MGSTPHSHAVADAKHPAEQGFTAMIVGWYFFAESNVKIVINSKAMTLNVFKGVVLTALVVGTLIEPTFVWELADVFMGIMAVPNIIALFLLSKEVNIY